jgi:hypothetical protein
MVLGLLLFYFTSSFFFVSFLIAVLIRFLRRLAMIGLEAAVTAIIEVLTRIGGLGIHFSIKVDGS